jgi:hypothetical protein
MNIALTHKRKAICVGALLAALLFVAGCADIQPYNPPNHREEGPPKGLFTGSQGEWVIMGPKMEDKSGAAKSEADREEKEKKNPEKTTDGTQ